MLFYGFAVVAPDVTADTGWSSLAVSGAFSVGLLVAGLAAPGGGRVARTGPASRPRYGFPGGDGGDAAVRRCAPSRSALCGVDRDRAWYGRDLNEPAMAVVVALDPSRRHRTLATITVVGGLASTVFAPLGGALVGHVGWRAALVVLAVGGGTATVVLHALVLPKPRTIAAPTQNRPRTR